MRINKFIAQSLGIGRRAADGFIRDGLVTINGAPAQLGSDVNPGDTIQYRGQPLTFDQAIKPRSLILFHKPAGYVVSRNGQGSPTIYDLLPPDLRKLKPVGRLDKASSGLLLLTDDGVLANELAHPRSQKIKRYEVTLDAPLKPLHRQFITDFGVALEDGTSKFQIERLRSGDERSWLVIMHEGRNRQIRRTFSALGYAVRTLHRVQFGEYTLGNIAAGKYNVFN